MRIAIISDTHNNLATAKKITDWLNKEKIKLLLHCGDISTQDTVSEIEKNFKGEVKFAKGNADFDLDIPEKQELQIEGKKIAFCHFPELAKELAGTGKYDFVFYGHTHQPWQEKIKNCYLVNPGEAAGQFTKPTFALYDPATGKLELKILELL
jgi:uncharacterized protein